MPTSSTVSKGLNSKLDEKKSSQANKDESENVGEVEERTFLDEIFQSDRVAQFSLLGLSVHLIYEKFNGELWFQEAWPTVCSLIVAYFANLLMDYRAQEKMKFPKFNTIYLFYLQLVLSILVTPDNLLVNTTMVFSISDMPLVLKVPLQMIFILLRQPAIEELKEGMAALALNYFLLYVLYKGSQLKSLDKVECHMFALLCTDILVLVKSDLIFFLVLKACLKSFIILVTAVSTVSALLEKVSVSQSCRTLLLLPCLLVGFPYIIQSSLVIEGKDPVYWLVDYISSSETRRYIMCIWIVSTILLIPSVFALKSNWSLNTSRKVWHFALLPLLIPAIVMDADFVKIALSGTIVLFLMVEYIRYLFLYPIGHYLDKHLRSFADFRDEKGPIIISYIYLIIGISLPFLMGNSIIGIISLGVGDSLASIVGKKYGKMHWPNTKKTLEGTIAFIVATTLVSVALKYYLNFFQEISFSSITITCFLAGGLEANSTLNDNLLIPTFMFILLETLRGV